MEEKDAPYSYLTQPFHSWVREKLQTYFEELETAFFYGEKHKHLLEEVGISEQEFYERFLKPYEGLSFEQIKNITTIQTELSHKYLKSSTHFISKPVLSQYMNAIEWTILNISDLHLEGLNVEPDADDEDDIKTKYLKEPYSQCRYCGRENKDPRGKPFGERGLSRCITNNDDLENRQCSKEWERFTNNTRDKINAKNQVDSINYFLKNCQERFEWNLTHAEKTIRTSIQKSQLIGTFIEREKSYA